MVKIPTQNIARLSVLLRRIGSLALMVVATFCFVEPSTAQIDPYAHMQDPLAISRLDDDFRLPVRCITQNVIPPDTESDGYHVLASITGTGMITHIWFVHNASDSASRIKLWVDDSLLASCTIREFVSEPHGLIRAPFARLSSGSSICDVQIPYKHSVRLTYRQTEEALFWYAFEYRPMPNVSSLPWLGSTSLKQYQESAEARYYRNDPWDGVSHDSIGIRHMFVAHDTMTLAELDGPGCIQRLAFRASLVDQESLDSMMLEIRWDHNPHPAVFVSLGKLLGTLSWPRKTHGYYITVAPNDWMSCAFPMPFGVHASIRLINARAQTYYQYIDAYVVSDRRPIDRSSYGYFFVEAHRSDPTRYHVWHPIIHTKGMGTFIGMDLQIPTLSSPVALEGDPRFEIDSDTTASFRLTGTEDYFDGGNYFYGGPFTDPFGGCVNWATSMYRFHVLNSMPFSTSLDVDFQHGFNTDVKEDYHSAAYYYKKWTPFWTDRDTISRTRTFSVAGSGYSPSEGLTLRLDSAVLYTGTTDQTGMFNWTGRIPPSVSDGAHTLSVNWVEKPEPLVVISSPMVQPLIDTLPIVLEVNDTLSFTAVGFEPGETCEAFIDSVPATLLAPLVVGNDNRCFGQITIPRVGVGTHVLTIVGQTSGTATSAIPIVSTGIRDYEFERLLPSAVASNTSAHQVVVSDRLFYHWGEQAVVQFAPQRVGDSVSYRFWVPVADTFQVFTVGSEGQRFGNCEIHIDGQYAGTSNGLAPEPKWTPLPSANEDRGTRFLDRGFHSCSFVYIGHDPASTDSLIEMDRLLLIPGAIQTHDSSLTVVTTPSSSAVVFPNPSSTGKISIDFAALDTSIHDARGEIAVVDLEGRTIYSQTVPPFMAPPVVTLMTNKLPAGRYQLTISITTSKGFRDFSIPFVVL